VAVETIEPFTLAALRHLIAGALLYVLAAPQAGERPTARHWRSAAVAGGLMLVGANGCVAWAQKSVESGVSALIVGTVPLWMVTLPLLGRGRRRPLLSEVAGIALGFAGIWVLVDPGLGHGVDPFGAGLLLFASLSWAAGSLFSRAAPLPRSPLLGTALQMLAGGALLVVAAGIRGEWARFDPAAFSTRSIVALAYLVLAGSLAGFTAYVWLLRVTTPAKATTYAYVNPVVAVFLGWALLDEPVTANTFLATALVVSAVVFTTVSRPRS
jgi:drug/metabolite transporter (DMT)-like permease